MVAVPTHETKEKIENSALRAFMVFLSLMLQIGWFIWLGLYLRQYYIVLSTAVMMISWVLGAVLTAIFYKKGKWKSKAII